MAISATAVWEMRTTGANTNGGFYKSDAGTTDYSQQDSAQLALTDIASDAAGTGISSTTGGFTAQMVGNGMYITGTGFTTGLYEITAYTDTNNITIDRSAGASASGGTGNVGGALALPTDAILESMVAGNKLWIKAGTYTFTESIAGTVDGTASQPIQVWGYNTTRGDAPTGDNRPLLAMGTYNFIVDNFWNIGHIRVSGSGSAALIGADQSALILNVKAEHTGSGNSTALIVAAFPTSYVSGCEATAPSASGNGAGIWVGGDSTAIGNYVHSMGSGSNIGIRGDSDCNITFNTTSDCATGISTLSANALIQNNTVYNCSNIGINATGGSIKVLNNDINSCGTGIYGNSDIELLDFNNYYNNTTDISNTVKGVNATANNPEYANAANGNFTNTLNVSYAMPMTATFNIKQGAWQNTTGNGETAYGFAG